MLKLIFAAASIVMMGNLVESKSLVETVSHDLYLKQAAEDNKVGQPHLNLAYHDTEHESSYAFIIWWVAKYKSFMRGISIGIYDDPA